MLIVCYRRSQQFIESRSLSPNSRANPNPKPRHKSPYLLVRADAGGAAEVELGLIHGQGLAHIRVTLAVEATALAAVHGQLPGLAPLQEAGVATQAVDLGLVGDLVFNLIGGGGERER